MNVLKRKMWVIGAIILLTLIIIYSSTVRGAPSHSVQQSFDTVSFDIENAIVNRGFVIDFKGDIAKMLINTSNVASDSSKVYRQATFWQFCSSDITRRLTNLSPDNLFHCPFVVYAYETLENPGTVHLGYRKVGDEAVSTDEIYQEINSLLEAILAEAT